MSESYEAQRAHRLRLLRAGIEWWASAPPVPPPLVSASPLPPALRAAVYDVRRRLPASLPPEVHESIVERFKARWIADAEEPLPTLPRARVRWR